MSPNPSCKSDDSIGVSNVGGNIEIADCGAVTAESGVEALVSEREWGDGGKPVGETGEAPHDDADRLEKRCNVGFLFLARCDCPVVGPSEGKVTTGIFNIGTDLRWVTVDGVPTITDAG